MEPLEFLKIISAEWTTVSAHAYTVRLLLRW
jgi:hypothetical protein